MFYSCSDDDADQDVIKPTISEVEIENEEDSSHAHDDKVHAGELAKVHFMLSDDKALSSWKVDIHDAFDGHSHGKIGAKFTKILSGSVEGTVVEVEADLGIIPADATAGEYHCIVNATDAAGNSSDFEEVIFILSNGSEPQLNLLTPDLENTEHMDKGSSFSLTGELTDDTGIESFEIFITEEDHDDHDHGKVSQEDILLFDKDDFAGGTLSFDLADCGTMTIPADMEDGNFYIKFVSGDADGNTMIEKFEVHIE